jgi:F0F1-type ATP synthase assembly protein I
MQISKGFIFSLSLLCGGLISIISNLVFTKIFFRRSNKDSAKKIIFSLNLGFLLKLIIVIFLFSCVFLINKLLSFWVILGFIFTTLLFLVANFFNFRKKK